MKLYARKTSPPSRFALLTLEALGMEYELITVPRDRHSSPEFLKINPQGQIPVLVDGDVTVTQSRAIAKYLCNAYGATSKNKNLYPNDLRVRTRIDELLFLGCDIEESIRKYSNVRSVMREGATGVNEAYLEKAKGALDAYERILSKQEYFVTNQETLADFAALVILGLLDMIDFDLSFYPGILKWKKRMSELPYYNEAFLKGHGLVKERYNLILQENLREKRVK